MSVPRKSRTFSVGSGSYAAELKAKWELWCEEEGVDDPPPLVKVGNLKRARHSIIPIVEQSEEEYVKLSSGNSRAEEAKRDSTTQILVHFENTEPFALKGVQVQGLHFLLGVVINRFAVILRFPGKRLINCSLVAESIHMLGYLLKNSTVSHLYLDENVIPNQNYYLILENNAKLLHFSLRLNRINDCGAEFLGRSLQYTHPHHQILRSLNLNCNLIDDDGACALAKALRWNRNLTCLALAGNRIGDRGGIALARLFLPFQLTQEELSFRAELLCNRLLQVKTLMEESGQRSKGNMDDTNQPPTFPGETSDLNEIMLYYYNMEKWAEDKTPQITNPIVSDVSETEDGNYLCKGNDAVWYLNLSYNLLTEEALFVFLDAFKHQESAIAEFDRKLWRFEYEGNSYDPEHPVVEEIEKYLNPYKSLTSLQGSGSRKGSKASLKSRISKEKK